MACIIEGTVCAWTSRVLDAILNIEPSPVTWPSIPQRVAIKEHIHTAYGVGPGCVGYMDGFHVVLAGRPRRDDGPDFFNRKERYSFNILGVCDHTKRIRFLGLGWQGSAHDKRVYRNSSLALNPTNHFSPGEWLLADSGYNCNDYTVSLFKRERHSAQLTEEQVSRIYFPYT